MKIQLPYETTTKRGYLHIRVFDIEQVRGLGPTAPSDLDCYGYLSYDYELEEIEFVEPTQYWVFDGTEYCIADNWLNSDIGDTKLSKAIAKELGT